jgi:predicted ATP-grasp superfamily ATP-dependent carboligase
MADISVNLDELKSEVAKLTPEQIKEKLLKLRTREKVQQKKSYNSESAKKYQAKAREQRKILKEMAIAGGYWDEVNEQAEAAADDILTDQAVAEGVEEAND